MSGIQFTPGRKGNLSKLLRKLYYCQIKPSALPFTGNGFTYTFENGQFVITFNTSGTIIFNTVVSVDYLTVGGGGGGGGGPLAGGGSAGGGGGGQVNNGTFYPNFNESVTVTVGNGGLGGLSDTGAGSTSGLHGQNTIINTGLFILNTNYGLGGKNEISHNPNGGQGGDSGSNDIGGLGGISTHKNGYNGTNGSGGGGGYYPGGSGGNGAPNIQYVTNYGAGGGGGNGENGAKGGQGGNIYAGNGGQCYPINPLNNGSSAINNYGGGGGGGTGGNGVIGTSGSGGNGGSGLVIFNVTVFTNTNTNTNTNTHTGCNIYENCACIQDKVNQIKTGYNDPIQPQNLRVSQLITQSVGGRTTFGNIGLGLGRGADARTFNTYLGGIEGQPGGSPRPIRNRF